MACAYNAVAVMHHVLHCACCHMQPPGLQCSPLVADEASCAGEGGVGDSGQACSSNLILQSVAYCVWNPLLGLYISGYSSFGLAAPELYVASDAAGVAVVEE